MEYWGNSTTSTGEFTDFWTINLMVQNIPLGGGFKYLLFSPLFGEDFQFDEYFSDRFVQPPTSPVFHIGVCFFWEKPPCHVPDDGTGKVPDPDVTSRRRNVLLRRSYLKNGCFWVLKNHHLLALRETAWYQIHQLFSAKRLTKCRCN